MMLYGLHRPAVEARAGLKGNNRKDTTLKAYVVMRNQTLDRSYDQSQAKGLGRLHKDIPHIVDSTKMCACLPGRKQGTDELAADTCG